MNTNTQGQMSAAYKKQLIKYLFQCIISEGSKILLFSVIFLKVGLIKEFCFALFLLILLRTNGGGLHFKHYISCFAVSFLVLSGSILLAIKFPFPNLASGITLVACIMLGYWCVPVVSANRPPANEVLIKKSKRNTVLVIFAYLILICIVPANRYTNIGVWIVVIHICQLLLAKILKRRRKKCGIC